MTFLDQAAARVGLTAEPRNFSCCHRGRRQLSGRESDRILHLLGTEQSFASVREQRLVLCIEGIRVRRSLVRAAVADEANHMPAVIAAAFELGRERIQEWSV